MLPLLKFVQKSYFFNFFLKFAAYFQDIQSQKCPFSLVPDRALKYYYPLLLIVDFLRPYA